MVQCTGKVKSRLTWHAILCIAFFDKSTNSSTSPPVHATVGGAAQSISCAGIPSAEVFGGPEYPGIDSEETFGTPAVLIPQVIVSGILSAESFGAPGINLTISVSGLPSAETFGVPRTNLTIAPSGISSAEFFGAPSLRFDVGPQGIATAETFGNPLLIYDQFVRMTEIPSIERFGGHLVKLLKVPYIAPVRSNPVSGPLRFGLKKLPEKANLKIGMKSIFGLTPVKPAGEKAKTPVVYNQFGSVIFYDSFSGDGYLEDHAPDMGSGWSKVDAGQCQLSGGGVRGISPSASYMTLDSITGDCFAQVKVISAAFPDFSLALKRAADGSDSYSLYVTPGYVELLVFSNGVWGTYDWAYGSYGVGTYTFTSIGDQLRGYVNGELVISLTDSSLTGGHAGLYAGMSSEAFLDDFEYGSVP
jgi:hypothetical protein